MARKFEPPPRGYYRTHRAAVEALCNGGISLGAFALYNVLAYFGWRDGKAAVPLDALARHLRTPLHLVTQWLGELEWSGLIIQDGDDGWVLAESLRRGKELSAARPAGAIGAGGVSPKVSRSVS